jgi:hypothetical protein
MADYSVIIKLSRNIFKIKRVILLLYSLLFFSYPPSSAQNFFPSEMNNRYQINYYSFHDFGYWQSSYADWRANAISNEIIINGKRFVKFSAGGPLPDYYYFDEPSAKLYVKNPDSVRLAIDFNTAPGDSFISYINGYAQYYVAQPPEVINFFGQQVLTKEFVHKVRINGFSRDIYYTFAENIGLIDKTEDEIDYQPFDYYMVIYQIRSAIIDTTNIYGQTSVQINDLSPLADRHENQFPFTLTGNYTSTLNAQGYGAPDDLVDSFYISIIQVRGSDTLGIFRYNFDSSGHAAVNILPHAGDKLLLKAYISDTTIFNNTDFYPDTGYAVINVLPVLIGPNYFPMKEGNQYQFLYVWTNYLVPADTSLIKLDIVKGDSIGGELFYRFVVTGYEHHVTFDPMQQFRYDSSNAKLWTKLPGGPQVRLAVDFEFPDPYTSYILATPLWFTPGGITQDSILGQLCTSYFFSHSAWTPYSELTTGFRFASGMGLFNWFYRSPPYGVNNYNLIAAILDSVVYSGPFRIDSISPTGNRKINQFPVPVKTFYNMDHFNIVDSFYLYAEHYRNGVLLQSVTKYIPHSVMQGFGTSVLNFPDRQIGDIIKLRAEASDICMLNHRVMYPPSGWVTITITDSITDADPLTDIITFSLEQNYPNPFNPSTTISYSIPEYSNVTIKIFDVLGNEIETLVDAKKPEGRYELQWNVAELPSGVYLYRLQAGGFIDTKKMILMK